MTLVTVASGLLVAPARADLRDAEPPASCRAPTVDFAACVAEARRVPDDETLEARGAVIGEIVVHAGDIFDTSLEEENNVLFRLANRLHRNTRPEVIAQLLTFRSGDPYQPRMLAESERLLRDLTYLYDAQIRPLRYVDNRVDLEVSTRDIWTLSAGVGFSRKGGENSTRFELQDTNFLGTGKDLTIERSADVDRTSDLYRYRDMSLGGTHSQLELWHADNSDGSRQKLKLLRPFYSLDSRWAGGVVAVYDDRIEPLYRLGKVFRKFRHRDTSVEAWFGLSGGRHEDRARRLRAGFTYEKDIFDEAPGFGFRASIPTDRRLAYPWIDFEHVEDGYIEARDLDRIARTEDVNLGLQTHVRVGWAPSSFNDESFFVFLAESEIGLRPAERQLVLLESHGSGRWARDGGENLLLGASARFYWRNFGDHLFFAAATVDATRERDPENQLLLGGDTGLRGYPLRYQDGDRRFLVTLEQRFYPGWNLFRVVNVGAAVFADVGRSWFADGANQMGVLRDAGVGLRLSSSRSAGSSMVHVDVAFPLDGDDSIDRTQFLISTSETF